ncbi:nibrin-like isoform X1 [Aedes aegypti]|uniref:Nibrin n=2 Tax=Aedes aegypti TaxID=7159 RepID=A0A1S4G1J0_AEDAE|nr:nibrin-like isoform X1 [Aedes aegypti]
MWFLKNVQNGTIYYVKPNIAKHTVSRSHGELIIQGDPSISRNHAFLYPDATTLKVVDAGSRYGTFVNDAIESERDQIAKNTPSELSVGDRLRFGKCLSVWTVGREDFDCITSTIAVDGRLKHALELLGGKVRDAFVEGSTRYLIMKSITTTPKLLMCLISQVPVVKPEYFEECVKAVDRGSPLPNVDDFIPEFVEAYVRSEGMSFGKVPERKALFKGKTFVFIKPKHMSQYEGIVKLAGGSCICAQKRKIAKAFFTGPDVIVMQAGMDSQMSQTSSQAVDGLTQIVSKAGRRLIPDAEIGLAILHCSLEKYCNPLYKFSNVLDLETIPFAEGGETLAKNSEECGGALKVGTKESISIPETESRDSSQSVEAHKILMTDSMDYSEQPLKFSEKDQEFAKPKKVEPKVGREKRKRETVQQQSDSPKEVKKARSESVEPKISEEQEIPSQLEIPETPASIQPSQTSNFSGFLSVNREPVVDEEPTMQKQKQKRPLNLLLDDGEGDLFNFEEAAPKRSKRQATIAEAFSSSQQPSQSVGRKTRHQAAEEEDLFSFDSGSSKRSKQKKNNERSVPSSSSESISNETKDSTGSAPSYKQFIKPIQIPMEGWLASTFCDLKIKSQKEDLDDDHLGNGDSSAKIKKEPLDEDEDQKTRVWVDGMEAMFQVRVKCMNLTSNRPNHGAGADDSTSFYSTGNASSTSNGKHNFKAFVKKQNYKPQQTVVRTKPVCVLDSTQGDHF